jgi:cyclic pyranopterin phosphate synthase
MAAGGAGGGEPDPAGGGAAELTHIRGDGSAHMVDVGQKGVTRREAVAQARVDLAPETLARITGGELAKGDVLAVARIAGIMAAKRTPELIPLCHPLPLDAVEVDLEPEGRFSLLVRCTCRTTGRTGVEMEALTGASVAALTVYDMIKSIDRTACISETKLLSKSGGRSGDWHRRDG